MNAQEIKDPFLIRTYFENDQWEELSKLATSPYAYGFSAYVTLVNDSKNNALVAEELIERLPENYPFDFFLVADSVTFTYPDKPILCVGFEGDAVKTFRVVPEVLWEVTNNLSIGNMYFDDFLDYCDENGVYRSSE